MDPRILQQLAEDWPSPFVYRTVTVPNPSAGANWTLNTPGEGTWGLVAVTATLVTSVAVANRAPVLNVTDGSNTLWSIEPGTVQAASSTVRYSWLPELGTSPTTIVGGVQSIAMPPTYLAPGMALQQVTSLLDGADQWQSISATVIECLTGHVERERTIEDSILDRLEARLRLAMGV